MGFFKVTYTNLNKKLKQEYRYSGLNPFKAEYVAIDIYKYHSHLSLAVNNPFLRMSFLLKFPIMTLCIGFFFLLEISKLNAMPPVI